MQVTERLLDIWSHIKSIINFLEQHPKSKRCDSKSYNVVKAVNDQLMVAKLSLFIYVAAILKRYLKKYLTEQDVFCEKNNFSRNS